MPQRVNGLSWRNLGSGLVSATTHINIEEPNFTTLSMRAKLMETESVVDEVSENLEDISSLDQDLTIKEDMTDEKDVIFPAK